MSEPRMLDAIARQVRLGGDASRRPWPLPASDWSQAQTRRDVLLAHWPVELDALARMLPPELPLDTFAGEAWLQAAACRVETMRLRGLPPVPGVSSFAQLELCTYVVLDDRPGIWHFSLDVPKQLLVEAAQRAHRLPAYRARLAAGPGRIEASRGGFDFDASWEPAGEPFEPQPGSLEHFLTERYAIYTEDGGRLYRAELNHAPGQLRRAEITVDSATLLPLPVAGEPLAFAAEVQDLLVWPLEEL